VAKSKKLIKTKRLIAQTKKAEKQARKRRMEGKSYSLSVDDHLKRRGHKIGKSPQKAWGVYWDDTAKESHRKDLKEISLIAPKDMGASGTTTWAKIQYREESEFIEIYSIDIRPKGTGYGTTLMRDIKKYADDRDKGVILTKVKNEQFAEAMGFKRRDPKLSTGDRLSETTGFAEYVYGDVPKDAINYRWVYSGGKLERATDYTDAMDGSDRKLIKMTRVVAKKSSLDSIKRMFERKGWYVEYRELDDGRWVLYGITEK